MSTLPLTPRGFSQRKQAPDLSLVPVSAPVHGSLQIQQSSCRMSNNLPVISSSSLHGKVSRPGQRRSSYQQVWAQAKEEMTCPGLLAKQQPNEAMPKPRRPGCRPAVSQLHLATFLSSEGLENEEPFHFFFYCSKPQLLLQDTFLSFKKRPLSAFLMFTVYKPWLYWEIFFFPLHSWICPVSRG